MEMLNLETLSPSEFYHLTEAAMISLQSDKMVNESELIQIKNEFLVLAKKCGVELDFCNTENSVKEMTPFKVSPQRIDSNASMKKSLKRKRRSYADKMLSDLANECTMTKSLLANSFNDDDDDEVEHINEVKKSAHDNQVSSSLCTSYRKAIDLNPLFSFTVPDKIKKSSPSHPRTLRRCDRMAKMAAQSPARDDNRLSPEGKNVDQCDVITRRLPTASCNNDNDVEMETGTISLRERLQPEGAESEPEKHLSLGYPGATPIPEHNVVGRRSSLFKRPSTINKETTQRDANRPKHTVSCKRSRSSRSSRTSSSKPLASSTMIDSLLDGTKNREPRELNSKTPMLARYPSVRRRLCYYQTDIKNKDNFRTISDQCSLGFLEPLSVIEPADRDGLGIISDTVCEERLIERPNSIPRTSTKVNLTPKQPRPVIGGSNESELSPPCSFYTLPSSSTLRDTYLENKFQLPGQKFAPEASKSDSDIDYKIELSSIVADSFRTSQQFKQPKGIPPRKQSDEARRRQMLRRTSTPLPSVSPLSEQDNTHQQSDSQNSFDKKSIGKKLKRFRLSFSRIRNTAPEIKTLARV